MQNGRWLYWTTALGTLGICNAAAAQDVAPQAPIANIAETETSGLTDIVVTAQKRSESIQDIPVTVLAVGGDQIAQEGIKDLFQVADLVPGMVFSRAPDDGLALTIRGLGSSARPQAFEQSVAVFTDGVFLGKGRLYSTSFFDTDRIEFIKGTQSTLLGKNASIGAISIVSRQPTQDLGFEARAAYELERGGYTFDGVANVPLNDNVGVRVAAHYNDLDGWVRNAINGHQGPQHKDFGLRATLRAEVTNTLKLTGSYQYSNNIQIGASYHLVGNIPPEYGPGTLRGPLLHYTSMTKNGDAYHRTRSHIASLKAELELGDHTLVSQTSYVAYNLYNLDDLDFNKDDAINFVRNEKYSQLSQELRIQSPTGDALEYMAGLYYLDSHWNSQEDQLWAVPGLPPPGSGFPVPPGQFFNGPFTNNFVQDSKTYSAFASGTWHILDTLRLAGGLRYTREAKDVVFGRTNFGPLTAWNTIVNPPFDPTALNHNSDFFDGNVSLQYDIDQNVMAYISYGHGSKSGGFVETNTISVVADPSVLVGGKVPAALVASGAAIKDEFTTSYEAGFKTTLLDRRLRLNLTAFLTKIKNFQDTVFTGGPLGFLTFNGPSRSKGFEMDTAFQLTPHIQFNAGATYADATAVIQPFDAAGNPAVDADGNPIFARYRRTQAPKLIYNAGIDFDIPINSDVNLRLGGSVRHRNSMYNTRQEQQFSKALTTYDASIGIESSDERWGIDLVAKNITNAVSEDFASPPPDARFSIYYGAHVASPNALRTITLSARVRF
ncbi:hypothetical protein SKP52_13215 [Sphingopyxis fribergensis]|uniref:TonB-dependent receptor n=1 Tax=Sphingopyxis fribergensis TaxID=1515612 RepID=A0A0A7PHE7_9SPHN|nr:TonB-dependent receptor [Sphingopyxis fribergensis]AJA09531.1 hypothetical protein SKP52_13215 [Sphingopyxis fribergensis]